MIAFLLWEDNGQSHFSSIVYHTFRQNAIDFMSEGERIVEKISHFVENVYIR